MCWQHNKGRRKSDKIDSDFCGFILFSGGERVIWSEIYDCHACSTEIMQEIDKKIGEEIEKQFEDFKEKYGQQQFEECRDRIFGIVQIAEKESFLAGVQYGYKILQEGLVME